MEKIERAMLTYKGFRGDRTIAHIRHNIDTTWPDAMRRLTGRQYGELMNVADCSYQDGKASGHIDMGDFGSPTDWIAGIAGDNGNRWQNVIEVDRDIITITLNYGQDGEIVKKYKLVEE